MCQRKKILVTGAGGSIGSEICRQILQLKPLSIILFEHSEHNLYQINAELSKICLRSNIKTEIIPILGSIINKDTLEETIKNFRINTIYHAAAYKHVNLIENNVKEGIRNNIFGTYNVALAAYDLNIQNLEIFWLLIGLSSDDRFQYLDTHRMKFFGKCIFQ